MDGVEFEVEAAQQSDFEQVVSLQKRNSLAVLKADELDDGFLSSSFSATQFAQISESVALYVARNNSSVIGFVCASTPEFNRSFPLPAAMIERFPEISIGSHLLTELRSFITGPVCVDKNYRGQGIFEALYGALFEAQKTRFDVALALISVANKRSIKAHQKVGMDAIDSFRFGDREFFIVARSLR